MTAALEGGRRSKPFPQMALTLLVVLTEKLQLDPSLTTNTKTSSRWIKVFNVGQPVVFVN